MFNYKRQIVLCVIVAGMLFYMTPAKAFYLEIPNILKFWKSSVKAQEVTTETIAPAQSSDSTGQQTYSIVQPMPPQPLITPPPQPTATQPRQPDERQMYSDQNFQPMPTSGGESQMLQPQDNQSNDERRMKDMQRSVRNMENQVNRFVTMINSAEKKGTTIPQEVKDNAEKVKTMISTMKGAQTVEELDKLSFDDLQDVINSLEVARQNVFEKAQRLDGLKRGTRNMEMGLKQFEKQVLKLEKQKVAVPTELKEKLTQIKTIVTTIKGAKTWDEVESAGAEDMQDLMQDLDDYRGQIEMLSRWPQTQRQINRDLANLDRQVKRSKALVASLNRRGVDLTTSYEQFSTAVDKLKSVRDQAVEKMKAGEAEEAFNLIEDDFFGQMDDTRQYQRVIETMSNLGKFTTEYKRGMAQAQNIIKALGRKKIDVSELKELYEQTKAKGDEVLAMIKSKDFDEDEVVSLLSEMEGMKVDFESKVEELTGDTGEMPWEKGGQQIQAVKMDSSMQRYLPTKQVSQPVKETTATVTE